MNWFKGINDNRLVFLYSKKFLPKIFIYNILLINIDAKFVFIVCFLKKIIPFCKFKIVVIDIILSKPVSGIEKITCKIKSFFLNEIDAFIFYIKDTSGYEKYFNIKKEKIIYIPYKINGFPDLLKINKSDKKYIFAGGYSKRDYSTFFKAMKRLKYRSLVLAPGVQFLKNHGTFLQEEEVPDNVSLVNDDKSPASWNNYIANSQLVVIPIKSETISPTGISTYLVAMALKKCVIITDSPATRNLIPENAALVVQPGDVDDLCDKIVTACENNSLREKIAKNGYDYAISLEGQDRLVSDITNFMINKFYYEKN